MLMFSVLEPLKIQFIQYMVLKQTIVVVHIEFRFEWFDFASALEISTNNSAYRNKTNQ